MPIEASTASVASRLFVFSYGFRPFFLLAGIYAIIPMATMSWALTTGQWPANALPLFAWHGHEMLFGFTGAAVAGFLLTAVPTWTSTKAVSGLPLMGLVLLWGAGRIAFSPWGQPMPFLVLSAGLAFYPALAITVAIPLIRTKNYRNLPFIILLAILFLGETAFHARYFAWAEGQVLDGLRLTLNTVMLMIVIVGGRIIPAFTRNALVAMGRPVKIRSRPLTDRAAIVLVVGVLLADVFAPESTMSGLLAVLAAAVLFYRLTGWGGLSTLDIPLLWVLHLGTCWLVLALVLKALWILGGYGLAMNWMHGFTAGAFGTMILGVMTRVALGHTGRSLHVSRMIVVSYVLVSAAALIRVFGLSLAQSFDTRVLTASILAWVAAFAIFLAGYASILFRPRPDGRSG